MNFREAKLEVIGIVKRPDKLTAAGAAINKAISLAALRNFSADTIEVTVPIDNTEYTQRLDLLDTAYWNRFRKIQYIRPTGYKKYLEWKDPSKIYNDGQECRNVWYRSGTGILISLSALQSSLEIGYYQYHTILVADADTDWMLNEIWPYILDYACGELFGDIGDSEDARRKASSAQFLLDGFARDLGDGVSYG